MDDFDMKPMMGIMMMLVMVSLIASMGIGTAQASPEPPPEPPPPQVYECPLEPGLFFDTYDELYQHFIISHPTEPIDIVWG